MKLRILGLVALALLALPALGQAVDLKIATVAPEGSYWMRAMRQGAEEIKARTGGRVVLKLYGGGVMGSEKSVFRKIRIGQLHGGAFTGSALEEIYPDAKLYGLPLVFRSYGELDYVRERMDKDLLAGLEKAGFVSFGFANAGVAMLMAGVPARDIGDLKGQKVWVPEGDAPSYAIMESVGLAPVPLPITDVMTGLQTRLIDAVVAPAVGAIAFQWHTRVRYVTDTPLAFPVATLVIDKRAFSRLAPEDRQTVRKIMDRLYRDFDRQARLENEAATRALMKQGLSMVEPSVEEVDRWRESADRVIRQLAGQGAFSPALYARLLELLAEYRRGGGKG